MIFYYIRHGDPIYNPNGLTPLGARQAEALGKRLAVHGLDRIFASSSERAIQTAKPAAELLKKKIEILDWANEDYAWQELTVRNEKGEPEEWCFDDREFARFMNTEEVRSLGDEWYRHSELARFEAGYRRIADAADALLESLGYRHDLNTHTYEQIRPNSDRVALFAHGGTGKTFLSHVLDMPFPAFTTHFDISHSTMTVINFGEPRKDNEPIVPAVMQFSSDSHLYKEGLPTTFCNRFYI